MGLTISNLVRPPAPSLVLPPDFPAVTPGKQRLFLYPTIADTRIWHFDLFLGWYDVGPGPYDPDGDSEAHAWADANGKVPGTGANITYHLHPLNVTNPVCRWRGFALPAGASQVAKIYTLVNARLIEPTNWLVAYAWSTWSIPFVDNYWVGGGVGPLKSFWHNVTPGDPSTFDYAAAKAYSYIDGTLQSGDDKTGMLLTLGVALVVDAVMASNIKVLPYLKIPQGQGQTINELDGHSSIAELDCETNDPGREVELLAARPEMVGSRAIFRMGFPGMDYLGDFLTLHTDQLIDVGRSADGWMEFKAQDIQRSLVEEIFTEGGPHPYTFGQDPPPEAPLRNGFASNGHLISDANPRYLYGNPIDLMLVALQNELGIGQASGADPADWRIYNPAEISGWPPPSGWTPTLPGVWPPTPVARPSSLIYPNAYLDIDSIMKFRNYDFSGDRMEFKLTRAVTGKSWIDDQILKPLGLFWIVRPNGQLTLKSMKSPQAVDPSVAAWTQHNSIGIPALERLPITNVLTMRFDADDANRETAARQYDSEKTFIEQESVDLYQQQNKSSVEATGLRISYGGMLRGQILANRVFRRHAGISGDGKNSPTPQYSFSTFLKEGMVEIGDFVRITHPLLLDLKTGTRGVTNALCEVIDKQPDYATGQFRWKVRDTRFMNLSTPYYILRRGAIILAGYKIAPVTVPEWTSASAFQQATYMFACDVTTREYSDSTPGHPIAGGSVVFQTGDYNSALPD